MTPLQKTCLCIDNIILDNYEFIKRHEYQVDIYPLFYKIYNDGGWENYVFIEGEDNFNKNFKLID